MVGYASIVEEAACLMNATNVVHSYGQWQKQFPPKTDAKRRMGTGGQMGGASCGGIGIPTKRNKTAINTTRRTDAHAQRNLDPGDGVER